MAKTVFSELPLIDMTGFQVVSGELFESPPSRITPTATVWFDSISFSKAALTALNSCERIRVEVHSSRKSLLIIPVTAQDKDGVRWVRMEPKEPITRKLDCIRFTSQLYAKWGWDSESVYRAKGRIVTAEKKIMLLFDFTDAESWKKKVKE